MKRLRRPKRVSPALPPPVASGPYPTVAVPDPASRNPCCADIRCRDICARHPDILDAIPAPVAGLPDISGGRRGGHRLDHGRGRGNADDDANARETGTGSERQCRSAEKGKDRSSVHAGDPGSCFSSVKIYRCRGRTALMAVNNFSISVCMRTPSDEMTHGMLHQQCINSASAVSRSFRSLICFDVGGTNRCCL